MPPRRHLPFLLAFAAGLIGLAGAVGQPLPFMMAVAADAFFVVYLGLTLAGVPGLTKGYLRKHAASGDAPVWLIFLVTIGTVGVAVGSLFLLINATPQPPVSHLVVGLAALPLGWFTIHIMSAIHYAHLFWQPASGGDRSRKGLEFPGTEAPEGWDFVYFACVIGMTAQTSDVQITGSHMRAFNLVHAIVSFFFNTVLVAAAVNVAVSLGTQGATP